MERTPDDNLVEYKNAQGEWVAFTAAEFKNKVVALAKGLIARGVMPGDSVSIIAHTCWQWTALDVAIMSIGALTVPVYETNSPAQVKMISMMPMSRWRSLRMISSATNRIRP